MKISNSKPVVFGVVAAFLLVIFLQMFLMARDNSATFDEPFHIYAGYLQWKHGYVTLNPPLITRLITLPLIGMNLPEPPIPRLPYEPLGFQAGKALVFQNDANTILFRARMADSVFTLLLAILVFAAAREMFGLGAGFIALGLIAFDPTLMGHSALATLDSGNAFFMFWASVRLLPLREIPGGVAPHRDQPHRGARARRQAQRHPAASHACAPRRPSRFSGPRSSRPMFHPSRPHATPGAWRLHWRSLAQSP